MGNEKERKKKKKKTHPQQCSDAHNRREDINRVRVCDVGGMTEWRGSALCQRDRYIVCVRTFQRPFPRSLTHSPILDVFIRHLFVCFVLLFSSVRERTSDWRVCARGGLQLVVLLKKNAAADVETYTKECVHFLSITSIMRYKCVRFAFKS